MRIGAIIDRRGLAGRLDLAGLVERLSDSETLVLLLDGFKASDLRALIQTNRLEGLVVAGRDEEHSHRLAADALHEAGADRLALKVVNLRELCAYVHPHREATKKARLLLGSAIAMARQYRWFRPANVRLHFGRRGGRLSRRALLMLPMLRYEVVPAVDQTLCVASRGCNLCLAACPVGAIGVDGSAAHIQKERCRDCGLCLAACPAGAIDHPTYRRRVMDAGLEAILADGADIRDCKIATFVCPGAMDTLREAGRQRLIYPPAILPLEVPCAGFVDWYLVLRAFDLGATAVALLTCGDGCRYGCPLATVTDRFSAIGRLLDAWRLGSVRLAVITEGSAQRLVSRLNEFAKSVVGLPEQPLVRGVATPTELHRYRLPRLVMALCQRLGIAQDLLLADDHLPFGQARLDEDACSLCGLCADRCPTGALAYTESQQESRLLLTASDCTGCGLCVGACPEAALRIERRLEIALLQGGVQTLKATEMTRCRRCGQPFAPKAMLSRILSQLGRAPPIVASYCPDCRMIAGAARQEP